MKKITVKIVLVLMCLVGAKAGAQTDLNKVVEDIRGDYNPELNDPVRFDQQPVIMDTVRTRIPVTYQTKEIRIPVQYTVDTIRAAVIRKEPVEKIYQNYLKAGFGLYTTPIFEFRHGSGRNKDGRYNLLLSHISSSGNLSEGAFSGYSQNKADVSGERYMDEHTLYGRLNYDRHVVHHYGFDPFVYPISKDSSRQRYNYVDVETMLTRNEEDSSALLYHAGLDYHHTGNLLNMHENQFLLKGGVFKYLDKELFGGNVFAGFYRNTSAFDTINYGLVKLNPEVKTRGRKWFIRAGMNIVFEMESDSVSKAHFYPDAEIQFNVVDNIIIPYVGINGDVEKTTLRELSLENQFVGPMLPLRNTNRKWNFFGGIRGAISSRISFNTKVSYSDYRHMPFFIADAVPVSQNYYSVVYDDVKLLTLHGEAGYTITKKLHVLAAGDYFRYDMTNESLPWHKPDVKLSLSARYSLFSKVIARADVYYLGKRFGRSNYSADAPAVTGTFPVELADVTDINLGFEYRYTSRLSGFLNFHNILASRYYRWLNYPSQRFGLTGGITLNF